MWSSRSTALPERVFTPSARIRHSFVTEGRSYDAPVSQLKPEDSRTRGDEPRYELDYEPYGPSDWGPVKHEPRFPILRKLAASRRNEAIRLARDLQII